MTQISQPQHTTINAINRAHEQRHAEEKPRGHMGVSGLGKPDDKGLWLNFRHAFQPFIESRAAILYNTNITLMDIQMKDDKITASFKFPRWMLDKLREGKAQGRGSQRKQLQDAFEAMYCADDGDVITDTDRIDWLADVNNTIGNVQLPRKVVIGNVASLRAAIDEAMKLGHD